MNTSYIYLLSNKNNTVIYTGITSDLIKRIYQHKNKIYKGFSSKYSCNKLVYFEEFSNLELDIEREKQLKSGNRKRKEDLINKNNSDWNDLSENWIFNF